MPSRDDFDECPAEFNESQDGDGQEPTPQLVIEFPASGKTYCHDGTDGMPPQYGVYKYSTYERGSVLQGQEKRTQMGLFESLEKAREEYPEAEWHGGGPGYHEIVIPETPPAWFDPEAAGETWDDDLAQRA